VRGRVCEELGAATEFRAEVNACVIQTLAAYTAEMTEADKDASRATWISSSFGAIEYDTQSRPPTQSTVEAAASSNLNRIVDGAGDRPAYLLENRHQKCEALLKRPASTSARLSRA